MNNNNNKNKQNSDNDIQLSNNLVLLNDKSVRRYWDASEEKWYFAIVDIIGVLTESNNPQYYWRKLKERLKKEGNETVTNCHGLKMLAADGKMRQTDVADVEQMFRLIQSLPSPKVETVKLWLAQVGYERIEEANDPEKSIDRAIETYQRQGKTKEWISQRIKSIDIRKDLTNEWKDRGVEGKEYAILTDILTFTWSGKTVKGYKELKGLKKESLRDNMSNIELVMNMLAEASTTEISKKIKPTGFEANKNVAKQGGTVAKVARQELEQQTGIEIISPNNAEDDRLEHVHDKISN